ncbi:MAG: FkbM family methyltransferase [Candidatus Aminicenantes bacterium]|nr:FkbM family methyltransferase [Candidatus Aminicenantes bacterium]
MSIKSKLFNLFFKLIKGIGYERIFLQKLRGKINSSPYNILPKFFCKEAELKFLDVGANRGQTIDVIIDIFPNSKIFSFEPTPGLSNELKKKYYDKKNLFIYDCAIGDFSGRIKFYTSEFSPTNSSLKPEIDLYKNFNSPRVHDFEKLIEIEVPIITLNEWFKNENLINEIDVLKIDTQGTEYNVLKGALDILSTKIKIVVFEGQFLSFYKDSVPFYKTIELLYENNFYLLDIFGYNYNNIQMIECDFVFINSNFYNIEAINMIKQEGVI